MSVDVLWYEEIILPCVSFCEHEVDLCWVERCYEATVSFSKNEDAFLSLWQNYYRTVAIKERKNTRLMKNFMPVRYWKFMPEKVAEEERLFNGFKED